MLLLSGGLDSPVAAYMMAKRGLSLSCIHFASPPYTSERARMKVLQLAKELTPWTGNLNVYVVPYTPAQEYLRDKGPQDLFTVLMRRSMLRIAQRVAAAEGAAALITGESLAQVDVYKRQVYTSPSYCSIIWVNSRSVIAGHLALLLMPLF